MESIRYIKIIPLWSSLRKLGNNRLLRSSYIWLLAVPFLANLLLKIGPEIKIPLWDSEIILNLSLPFSWQMFYFSAVAFAIASAIYSIGCPKIVSDYERYSEFKDEGKGQDQIKTEFIRVFPNKLHKDIITTVKKYIIRYCLSAGKSLDSDWWEYHLESESWEQPTTILIDVVDTSNIEIEKQGDAFWYVRSYADSANPVYRILCIICYLIAFIFVFIVLGQNFLYVWRFVSN